METDVTGDSETLYTVSPVAAEWRREVPNFASSDDEPIEVTKTKDYGHSHYRVDYHFGVPSNVEWTGGVQNPEKVQFIQRALNSRILVAKNGPIYKAETTSTVNVNPHPLGKQVPQVHSKISLRLVSYMEDTQTEWDNSEENRVVKNLLYSLTQKQFSMGRTSSTDEYLRERRSAHSKTKTKQHKVKSQQHSSSSESESGYVNDDIPNNSEPAYAALYMGSQTNGNNKENSIHAHRITQDLAHLLRNPNNMPQYDFLTKFNVLVRLLSTMNFSQLTQTTRSIEAARSHKDATKAAMWPIIRDAVVQTGTLPAFQQIRSWITNKQIKESEAALVVSDFYKAMRYPTKEAMVQFFQIAMDPEVREQQWFNTTALIVATSFINAGQVNRNSAHQNYPTHMYGQITDRDDGFVTRDVLPKLKQELQKAVEQGDSHKTQIYIKAIGNVGHSAILNIFAPYLEGTIAVTKYTRTAMVYSLRNLALINDKRAIAVLYSILRNTGEPYEIRVAAFQTILVTSPNFAMMQGMAEMTQNDPSIEVRAIIKYAITSLAQLKNNPNYQQMAKIANAVNGSLTKEEFDDHYSKKVFKVNHDEVDYNYGLRSFTRTGDRNSIFPKTFTYYWRGAMEAIGKENVFYLTTSNIQKLSNALVAPVMESIFGKKLAASDGEPNHKFTAKKIAETLNIKRNEGDPLEAALYLDIMNQQRLFAIGESDTNQIGNLMKIFVDTAAKGGQSINIFNMNQVSIMFPLASGMPFIYKFKQPTVAFVKGQANLNSQSEGKNKGKFTGEAHVVLAQNHDGSVGFLDTLSNHVASVGIVKKLQFQVAFKLGLEAKSGEVKVDMKPIDPDQDTTILHYSVWPYTANQEKNSLTTVSLDKNTKLINRQKKVLSVDTKFGHQVGSILQVQGYSYSEDFRGIQNIWQLKNPLDNIVAAYRLNDAAQTHFNLRYLGMLSKNKQGVKVTVVYDTLYNQKQKGKMSQIASSPQNITANSANRREELIKRVVAGIDTATARILDLSATFNASQKVDYILTFAVANSPVDRKTQYELYASKNVDQTSKYQINAVATVTAPVSTSPLNFREALTKDLKMTLEADIRYGVGGAKGQQEDIQIKGESDRTNHFVEELQKLSLAKQCNEEIAQGNNVQQICHKMIAMAHLSDRFKLVVTNVNNEFKRVARQILIATANINDWQIEVNPIKTLPQEDKGKVEMVGDIQYLRNERFNLKYNSNSEEILYKNVPLNQVVPAVLSSYWPTNAYERVFNRNMKQQYLPYCTVDGTKVKTFSNREYNYTLSYSWHVVMQDQKPGTQEELVVMAKRPSEELLEVYISYRSPNGKDVEIEVKTTQRSNKLQVKINTDANKVSDGELKMYWNSEENVPILQQYNRDGILMMNIQENRLRVMYDGQRLVLLSNLNRNNNRGICGYMSSHPRDDYKTPYGLVDQPELYGASYTLDDENGDPETKELKTQAKNNAYQSEIKYTAIPITEEQQGSSEETSSEEEGNTARTGILKPKSYLMQPGPCKLQKQVQFYENSVEMCITTTPVPVCQPHCKGVNFKLQGALLVCGQKGNQQFLALRDQIWKGQNPEAPLSTITKPSTYRVPEKCKA